MQNGPFHLPAQSKIAHAHLNVRNLDKSLTFYVVLIGLKEAYQYKNTAALSATGETPYHLILSQPKNAAAVNQRAAGLFHTAIRFPTRKALAQVITRLLRYRWPLQGASDHGVSEAIYLPDPDGNGVELYVDRPESQWPKTDGALNMVTLPLDISGLLSEAPENEEIPAAVDPGTDIGHIHLQVTGTDRAETFYHQVAGMDIMQRYEPGGVFFASGGYHHHIGANSWNSQNGPSAGDNSLGLKSFAISLPDKNAWFQLQERLIKFNYPVSKIVDYGYGLGLATADLDKIQVEFLTEKSKFSREDLAGLDGEKIKEFK